MRYEKGTMELSPARDIPLLQQVLRSGFVTGNQLYEFMRLEQTEGSRQAFDHRVRRLRYLERPPEGHRCDQAAVRPALRRLFVREQGIRLADRSAEGIEKAISRAGRPRAPFAPAVRTG